MYREAGAAKEEQLQQERGKGYAERREERIQQAVEMVEGELGKYATTPDNIFQVYNLVVTDEKVDSMIAALRGKEGLGSEAIEQEAEEIKRKAILAFLEKAK